ncbi:MAG: heme ABC transporter ATP-binding protein [Rhodospirillales bacterium]|nr:MAG: heme ABC transporter ATP-binding protein [Rhodospirillales bacterium]
MLSVEAVAVRLGEREVLSDTSCHVAPGEVVAVIGPNGAGKTTLLHVMAGTLKPDRGCVRLESRPLSSWPRLELARRRAVLPQQAPLTFPFSVLEVVLLGRSPHQGTAGRPRNLAVAEAVMAETGILDLADRRYTELSGGERQRVQLARALAQIWPEAGRSQPTYLMLDEPTNNLDLGHQTALLDTARRLAHAGCGVLAILHDINLAAVHADRMVLIAGGRVFAAGSPAEVVTAETIQAAFGLPVRVVAHPEVGRPMVLPVQRPPLSRERGLTAEEHGQPPGRGSRLCLNRMEA